jgi:hypothetical protein
LGKSNPDTPLQEQAGPQPDPEMVHLLAVFPALLEFVQTKGGAYPNAFDSMMGYGSREEIASRTGHTVKALRHAEEQIQAEARRLLVG